MTAAPRRAVRTPQPKGTTRPSSSGNGVVGGYNIRRYATDPNHEKAVGKLFDAIPALSDAHSAEAYIRGRNPKSPVTGQMVDDAARKHGVDPRAIMAIIEHDSALGTKGKGARTNNPGNVGNDDTGKERTYGNWSLGVEGVAQWLARNQVEATSNFPHRDNPENQDQPYDPAYGAASNYGAPTENTGRPGYSSGSGYAAKDGLGPAPTKIDFNRSKAGPLSPAEGRIGNLYEGIADAIADRTLGEDQLTPERRDPTRNKLATGAALGLDAIGSALRGQPGGQVYNQMQRGQEAAYTSQEARAKERREFENQKERDFLGLEIDRTKAIITALGEEQGREWLQTWEQAKTEANMELDVWLKEKDVEIAKIYAGKDGKGGGDSDEVASAYNFITDASAQMAQQLRDQPNTDPEDIIFLVPVFSGAGWETKKIIGVSEMMNRVYSNAMGVPEERMVRGGKLIRPRDEVKAYAKRMLIERWGEASAKKKAPGLFAPSDHDAALEMVNRMQPDFMRVPTKYSPKTKAK